MTTRRRIAWALAAALFCFAAAAAGLPPQYAGTPTAKEVPDADVLVLSDALSFTLLPDGRQVQKVRTAEKILTYQGMDEAGDPKVAFQKAHQDLTVDLYRTYTPEGAVVDAKPNSFNEMTPFALAGAPAYADWRQMVMTKVGLDVNAVAETEYAITDKDAWRPYLEHAIVLQDDRPALERTVSVTVPEGATLRYRLFNDAAEPAVSRAPGTVTYTWTLKNVPLAPHTEMSGPEEAFLKTLVFTTCPGWKERSDSVGALVAAAVDASPAMDRKVEELTKGTRGAFEKILKLNDYVAEAINGVRWPAGDFNFAPRPASQVFDTGYGHALDKAVLLAAMLKKVGLKSAVAACAATVPGGPDPAQVPCLAQMDRFLVRVDAPGRDVLWIDPTAKLSERSQRDFQGYKGLPLLPGFDELHTMTPVGEKDMFWANFEAKAADDLSLEGTALVTLAGRYSPFYAIQGSSDDQKAFAGGLVRSVLPGASVTEVSVVRLEPGQTVLRVGFRVPAPVADGKVLALRTGAANVSVLEGFHGSFMNRRRLPLVLAGAGSEHVHLRVALPASRVPFFVPKGVSSKGAAGSFEQVWSLKEGVLEMDEAVEVPGRVVAAGDYPAFRTLAGLSGAEANRTVLFQ